MSGKSPIQIYMVALDGDTPATAQALQRYLMTVLGKANVTLSLVPTGAQVSSTLPDEIPTPGPAAGSVVCLVVLGSQWSQLAADTPGLMPWLTRQATREDVLFLFARTGHQPSLPPALARSPALANKTLLGIKICQGRGKAAGSSQIKLIHEPAALPLQKP